MSEKLGIIKYNKYSFIFEFKKDFILQFHVEKYNLIEKPIMRHVEFVC